MHLSLLLNLLCKLVFFQPYTRLKRSSVTFQGKNIAQIALPPSESLYFDQFAVNDGCCSVCAAANVGVPDYEANAHLTITDTDRQVLLI